MKKNNLTKKKTAALQPNVAEEDTSASLAAKQPLELRVKEILLDSPIYVNSIGATFLGLDHGSVLRELLYARGEMIRFYMSESGGNLTQEKAIEIVDRFPDNPENTLRQVMSCQVTSVSWYGLQKLYNYAPQLVRQVWNLICEEAKQDFLAGHRMARNFQTTDWQRDPWTRAQFLAIRNGFIEQWKPKGAIEISMIDMMAQSYSEYQYWSEEVHRRSTSEMKEHYFSQVEENHYKIATGNWIPPRVSEQSAIDHAMQMVDRYNRLFLRTLRQLRDLRRYSMPVTINNPAQVNIAADGGQQINAVQPRNQSEPQRTILAETNLSGQQ